MKLGRSLLGFLLIYIVAGALLSGLSVWSGSASNNLLPYLLLIAVAIFVSILWVGRWTLEQLTAWRASIWEMVWYLVGLPIVLGLVLFLLSLPLGGWGGGVAGTLLSNAAIVVASGTLFWRRHTKEDWEECAEVFLRSLPSGGPVISREELESGGVRYLFGDGRAEYKIASPRGEVLHRDSGPAVILDNGTVLYYKNGLLDGSPAIEVPGKWRASYRKGIFRKAEEL